MINGFRFRRSAWRIPSGSFNNTIYEKSNCVDVVEGCVLRHVAVELGLDGGQWIEITSGLIVYPQMPVDILPDFKQVLFETPVPQANGTSSYLDSKSKRPSPVIDHEPQKNGARIACPGLQRETILSF